MAWLGGVRSTAAAVVGCVWARSGTQGKRLVGPENQRRRPAASVMSMCCAFVLAHAIHVSAPASGKQVHVPFPPSWRRPLAGAEDPPRLACTQFKHASCSAHTLSFVYVLRLSLRALVSRSGEAARCNPARQTATAQQHGYPVYRCTGW